ncbi:MAG TPA: polyamine aminopropyltransferase [Desulfobacteraceae bacterium]|nr:polyamine aminopropyltransferase [Desulfobacteraceae bacterium]|tara:strand:- start:127 stop:1803 length:1677 start_codon:yes stop_codon:yes gene_type:complete
MSDTQRPAFNFASALLCACMFASGACGIILEYIQASLASMILGNAFEQWAMVIGLMMFWMGFGSLIQARIPKGKLIATFVLIEIALALAGGYSPTLTYLSYGYTSHYSLVLYLFVSLIGILIGLEIPVIIRINNDFSRELSTNLGNILSADYIGSLAGALIYVFLLLRFFPITEAAFLTAGMNFSLALVTFVYFSRKRLIPKSPWLALVMLLTCGAVIYGYMNNRDWQIQNEQPLYDDPIVYSKTSQYQHIVITHYPPLDETRLFLNGNLQLCSTDEARYHESLVIPAMTLSPSRQRVLILGGGDGAALREVLKFKDVKEVMLVDLDPAMTQLAATHPLLARINGNAFADARVVHLAGGAVSPGPDRQIYQTDKALRPEKNTKSVHLAEVSVMNVDADRFLAEAKGVWDVIIVDMPDPSTPELTKLYSREFYLKARDRLSAAGIMAIQATSPYLARESFLCIGRTLSSAGFSVTPYHENVPSFGDWGWYLAVHRGRHLPGSRIRDLTIDVPTRFLTSDGFKRQLIFGKDMLVTRRKEINTILFPVLLSLYNHESWLLE